MKYAMTCHRPISTFTSRAPSTISAARAACSTTWCAAMHPRVARQDHHPESRTSWQIAKDGKTYTFLPAQGRAVPRRSRVHPDDVEGRPMQHVHLASQPERPFPALDRCSPSGRDHTSRQAHRRRSSSPSRGPRNLWWRPPPRLERDRPVHKTLDDNGQNLRASSTSRHRPLQEQAPRRERSLGDGEARRSIVNKGLSRRHRVLSRVPSRPSWARPCCRGGPTSRTSSIRDRWQAKDTAGCRPSTSIRASIQGTWMNSKKKPFDDARVRRAMHLAFDRPVLVDVVKDVAPMWSAALSTRSPSSPRPRRAGEAVRATRRTHGGAKEPRPCWLQRVIRRPPKRSTSWCAMSPASSYGRRRSRRCCRKGST